jgi:hypothetical protein
MDKAARLLLRDLEQAKRGHRPAAKTSRRAKPAQPKKPLTRAQFDQHLLELGLMTHIPNTAACVDDPDDEPTSIRGEPLSETVIRERRCDGGLFPRYECLPHGLLNLSVETLRAPDLWRIDFRIHSPKILVSGMYQLVAVPYPARLEQTLNLLRDRNTHCGDFWAERIRRIL